MYALSIKQPWAWLICAGYKDVENRDWATKVRGRVYIHTGKSWDANAMDYIRKRVKPEIAAKVCKPQLLPLGSIIGEVDIVNCLEYWSGTKNKSPWFVGRYGFFLANPVLYEKPIPYKGQLGFFEVSL